MIKIQKLNRPTKRSGYKLDAGAVTSVRGLKIINTNKFAVYIDKFTRRNSRCAGGG